MKTNQKTNEPHRCAICNEPYKKQDFSLCPHCGGDGGNRTKKEWRPTKKQKIEFAKKISREF